MRPAPRGPAAGRPHAGAGRAVAISAVAALAGACLFAFACSRPTQAPAWQAAQGRRNEITALWTQIRDWRREAGLQVEPEVSSVVAIKRMSVSTAARACVRPREQRATCTDVCDLADAICDNAENICALAAELGNDAWAQDKCDSAKASCREAQQRCCTCDRDREPEVSP